MARRNQSQPAEPVDETKDAEVTGDGTDEALPEIAEDEEQPAEPVDDADTVLALVLSDSVYGKCGEVKRFAADLAPAIAAAGYIDTHPNAVASVEH